MESWSDVSSDSDVFHAEVDRDKDWQTFEDLQFERVLHISEQLRAMPVLPPEPTDPDHVRP